MFLLFSQYHSTLSSFKIFLQVRIYSSGMLALLQVQVRYGFLALAVVFSALSDRFFYLLLASSASLGLVKLRGNGVEEKVERQFFSLSEDVKNLSLNNSHRIQMSIKIFLFTPFLAIVLLQVSASECQERVVFQSGFSNSS